MVPVLVRLIAQHLERWWLRLWLEELPWLIMVSCWGYLEMLAEPPGVDQITHHWSSRQGLIAPYQLVIESKSPTLSYHGVRCPVAPIAGLYRDKYLCWHHKSPPKTFARINKPYQGKWGINHPERHAERWLILAQIIGRVLWKIVYQLPGSFRSLASKWYGNS